MLHLFLRLRHRGDDGATAVEYSLLAVAIAAVIVVVVFVIGKQVRGMFSNTCDSISANASVGVAESCG